MTFNQAQISAVMHMDGPALVISGPGSGKTTVITHRIKYMVEQGVDPASILVVTFSRAAADEMEARYNKLMSADVVNTRHEACRPTQATFGTFHSIYLHILKYSRECACNIPRELDNDIEKALENISVREECSEEDYENMLTLCNRLLHEDCGLLKDMRERYIYILIDEFQDINQIQYDTIKMLAAPRNNIFAVGDDDQSIYGFRGAEPGIMFDFVKTYPSARQIYLDINYRSGSEIVNAAAKLISHNRKRFKKNIRAAKSDVAIVDVRIFLDREMQARAVVRKIIKYADAGVDYSDMAVLYRINSESKKIERELARHGVPFIKKTENNSDCGDITGVKLFTMHGAKGLEFKIVFIITANEKITPEEKARTSAGIEEERRVFYVAVTRAAERLHVYFVEEDYGKRMKVSRFVREMVRKSSGVARVKLK